MSAYLLRRISRNPRVLSRIPQRWSSSISQRPGSDRYVNLIKISPLCKHRVLCERAISADGKDTSSVRFPGAVNSKFTTDMAFINPSTTTNIPTYRVMDSDGVLLDKNRKPSGVSNEEILTWYKNMLTGRFPSPLSHHELLLITFSECDGRDYVRGPKTGPSELLHGMCPHILIQLTRQH